MKRLIGLAICLVALGGCGLGSGSIDDFKSLEPGDCVEGNVLIEYGWDRIDCSEMVSTNFEQYRVTWVGSTSDADRLDLFGATFSGDCPLPVEGEGVVVCFK